MIRFPACHLFENATTICAPTIQFKAIGIDHDEQVTCSFLSSVPKVKDRLNIASGYLNFTDTYTNLMATSGASIHAMTASPKANGFYTANGVSGSLPLAYSLLEQQFIETFNKTRTDTKINMHEYGREGWTFHGKGMWFIPGGNVNEKHRWPFAHVCRSIALQRISRRRLSTTSTTQ